MNRQFKREMRRQEARRRAAPRPVTAPQRRERTRPRQFLKEVGAELQKVHWPTRQEVASYTTVVIVAVLVIALVITGLDYLFTQAVLLLFGVEV